jgi:hypothetical protein
MRQKPIGFRWDHTQAKAISSMQGIPRKVVCILDPSAKENSSKSFSNFSGVK